MPAESRELEGFHTAELLTLGDRHGTQSAHYEAAHKKETVLRRLIQHHFDCPFYMSNKGRGFFPCV